MDEGKLSTNIDKNLAHRLHRAVVAGPEELFQVHQDPDMEVLKSSLKNRNLHDDHLMSLLKRRDLSEGLLKAIYQHDRVYDSHQLKVSLVKNPNTPSSIVLAILPQMHLFELVNLCFLPGVTPDQKYAAERAVIQRLPALELGKKMTLARRATANIVGELLKSGESRLVDTCLSNPRLREVAILQFLNSAAADAETISMVARHSKWKTRPNLQMAILKNNRTPPIWYTLFLPRIRTSDIRNILISKRLKPTQKKLVQDELLKRGF